MDEIEDLKLTNQLKGYGIIIEDCEGKYKINEGVNFREIFTNLIEDTKQKRIDKCMNKDIKVYKISFTKLKDMIYSLKLEAKKNSDDLDYVDKINCRVAELEDMLKTKREKHNVLMKRYYNKSDTYKQKRREQHIRKKRERI